MPQEGMEPRTKAGPARSRGGLAARLCDFARDMTGGFSVTAAVAFPALGMATALLVDGTNWMTARSRLQAVADGAALSLASASAMTTYATKTVQMAAMTTPGGGGGGGTTAPSAGDRAVAYVQSNLPSTYVNPDVQTSFDPNANIFTVTVAVPVKTFLGTIAGPPYNTIRAKSSARLIGSAKLCLVTMEPNSAKSIQVAGASIGSPAVPSGIVGNGCSFFVNSTNPQAIRLDAATMLQAQRVIGAGPVPSPAPANFQLGKPVADPLGNPTPPTSGTCRAELQKTIKLDGSASPATTIAKIGNAYYLGPDNYCGGIEVTTGNQAVLNTGVFFIGGSGLVATGGTIRNQAGTSGVTLVMDKNAPVKLTGNVTVNLNAVQTGSTAGILLWVPGSGGSSNVELSSTNARNLTGVIYMPNYVLTVKNAVAIADQSPWTAIVANKIDVSTGAKIVLNSNYDTTSVPPPPLLKSNPALQNPVLTH